MSIKTYSCGKPLNYVRYVALTQTARPGLSARIKFASVSIVKLLNSQDAELIVFEKELLQVMSND